MINANELRLGNWVMYDGKHCTVKSIFGGTQNLIVGRGGINPYAYVEKVDPIPLTPEMLDKMGFKSDFTYTGRITPKFIMIDNWYIEIFFEDGNYLAEINGARVIINSVHQLQNMVFALTGKEITFEL